MSAVVPSSTTGDARISREGGAFPVGTTGNYATEFRVQLSPIRKSQDEWSKALKEARDSDGLGAVWDISHSTSSASARWCSEAVLNFPQSSDGKSVISPYKEGLIRLLGGPCGLENETAEATSGPSAAAGGSPAGAGSAADPTLALSEGACSATPCSRPSYDTVAVRLFPLAVVRLEESWASNWVAVSVLVPVDSMVAPGPRPDPSPGPGGMWEHDSSSRRDPRGRRIPFSTLLELCGLEEGLVLFFISCYICRRRWSNVFLLMNV